MLTTAAHQLYQATIELIEDLFTESPKTTFRREEVLIVLNNLKNHPQAEHFLKDTVERSGE